MRINLVNHSIQNKECFYFEIIRREKSAVSSDLGVATLLNLNKEEYVERLIKAFNNSYMIVGEELYLIFDKLDFLTEKELKKRFEEEFCLELIPVKLAD